MQRCQQAAILALNSSNTVEVAPMLHYETVCEVSQAVRKAPLVLTASVRNVHFVQAEASNAIRRPNALVSGIFPDDVELPWRRRRREDLQALYLLVQKLVLR